MIRALVFDLDDTLIKERDYVFSGLKVLDRFIIEIFNKKGFYEEAVQQFQNGERKKIFNKSLDNMDIIYDETLVKQMITIYRTHEPEIKLLEDANWVINNLTPGISLGLISDGYLVAQTNKVKALNLRNKFSPIILTDAYGRENWKPSLVPFKKAKQFLKCEHHECVYIGDNCSKDFFGPNKLGWTTVHINRSSGIYTGDIKDEDYKAHYQIKNLRELVNVPKLKNCFKACMRGETYAR